MRRRGLTLIELLLALTITALIMVVAGNAYVYGARTQQTLGNGRDAIARRAAFESGLKDLFAHAYLDTDTTDQASYFISGDALSSKTVQSSTSSLGQDSTATAGSLTFTVLGRRLPSTFAASIGGQDDSEALNDKFGAIGGMTEVQLGTTPVGAPSGEVEPGGLYLREQAPSDADPTQGGEESKLSPDLDTIGFEYYDGSQWLTTWDTTTMTTRRLPSAVRVTYRLKDDPADNVIVLPVPASDVTPDNPVQDVSAS